MEHTLDSQPQSCLKTPVWADGSKLHLRGEHPSAIWPKVEYAALGDHLP